MNSQCQGAFAGDCAALTGSVKLWYCKGKGVDLGPEGGCQGNDPLPSGVHWNATEKKIVGSFCGVVQADSGGGKFCSRRDESACGSSETPPTSPSPSPSASASPSPSPTLGCIDLTSDEASPSAGDEVTFTCEANFSGMSPVAFFRYSSDNEATWSSAVPASGVAINATTHKASHNITINRAGDWAIQCRVCASAAAASCTAWGQAGI
jgi:hypothetical protein